MRGSVFQYPRAMTIRYLQSKLDGGYGATGKPLSPKHRRDIEQTLSRLREEEAAESKQNAPAEARCQASPPAGGSAFNSDFAWYCPTCDRDVQNEHVTFQETHDPRCGGCGNPVEPNAQFRGGGTPYGKKPKRATSRCARRHFRRTSDKQANTRPERGEETGT